MATDQAEPRGEPGDKAKTETGAEGKEGKKTSDDVVRQQQRKLCEQFIGKDGSEGDAQIGLRSLELLPYRGYLFGGKMAGLPAVPQDEAFVWSRGDDDHELWVRAAEKGTPGACRYRSHWSSFCKEYYGVDWNISGRKVNIDHLFPETAGTLQNLSYIRLLPVSAKANRAQSALEKQMAAREREIGEVPDRKIVRHATPETLAKVTDFREWIVLPDDRAGFTDFGRITRLIDHVRRHVGIDEPEVLRQLMIRLTHYSVTDKQTPLDQRSAKRAKWQPFIP